MRACYDLRMRTTLDIDARVLRALKRLPKKEKKSLGQLAFELLAEALLRREEAKEELPPFRWHAGALEPRVPLDDQEAIFPALDE